MENQVSSVTIHNKVFMKVSEAFQSMCNEGRDVPRFSLSEGNKEQKSLALVSVDCVFMCLVFVFQTVCSATEKPLNFCWSS